MYRHVTKLFRLRRSIKWYWYYVDVFNTTLSELLCQFLSVYVNLTITMSSDLLCQFMSVYVNLTCSTHKQFYEVSTLCKWYTDMFRSWSVWENLLNDVIIVWMCLPPLVIWSVMPVYVNLTCSPHNHRLMKFVQYEKIYEMILIL